MNDAPSLPIASAEELRTVVKAYDYDRYVSAVLTPPTRREEILILCAFDAELARIPAAVSEPLIGEIRLQWWRDALASLLTDAGRSEHADGAATGHPIADALLLLARRRRLPAGLIHGLIDARSTELSDAPLRDITELRSYLDKTDAALASLIACILAAGTPAAGRREEINAHTRAAGRAVGLTRLCRRLLSLQPQAEMLVPLSLWPIEDRHAHAGDAGTLERFAAGRNRAAGLLLDLVDEEFDRARAEISTLPPALRPAILPVALVPRYVTHVRGALSRTTTVREISTLGRLWTLWRASARARVI